MLSEEEIRERAKYCYLVSYQLSCLRSLELANPAHYLKVLEKSSLHLIDDEFILMTMEDEFRMGSTDCGLDYLMALYEGFAHAYCEVLEKPLTIIRDNIPGDFLKKLASEMEYREMDDRIQEPE